MGASFTETTCNSIDWPTVLAPPLPVLPWSLTEITIEASPKNSGVGVKPKLLSAELICPTVPVNVTVLPLLPVEKFTEPVGIVTDPLATVSVTDKSALFASTSSISTCRPVIVVSSSP